MKEKAAYKERFDVLSSIGEEKEEKLNDYYF